MIISTWNTIYATPEAEAWPTYRAGQPNILACVCARAGSERVPGKALRKVGGMTLLENAIACALEVGLRVVVSSDGFDILNAASSLGVPTIVRPDYLATSTASKWDVFRGILDLYPGVDILVDLDVGCPMRLPEDVLACVGRLGYGFDVVATAYESDRNPYFNMVEYNSDGSYSVAGAKSGLIVNGQDAPDVYSLSPAVYAMRADAVYKHAHWSTSRMSIHVVPRWRAWDIDTLFDLRVAEHLMRDHETLA